MINIDVKIEDHGLAAELRGMAADLEARTELNTAIASAVEDTVRGYLLEKNSASPNTGFYAKAARSVESAADGEGGAVRIPHRGMALRYYGGRVDMKDRLLALSTENVPVRGDERMRPREMGDLQYRRAKKDAAPNVRGYLLQGDKLMYVLCEWTDHKEDPSVIPDVAALTASAEMAAGDYLTASRKGGTP